MRPSIITTQRKYTTLQTVSYMIRTCLCTTTIRTFLGGTTDLRIW